MTIRYLACFITIVMAPAFVGFATLAEPENDSPLQFPLSQYSNSELILALKIVNENSVWSREDSVTKDDVLLELIRRKDSVSIDALKDRIRKIAARKQRILAKLEGTANDERRMELEEEYFELERTLPEQTAIRRLQKKPDPLEVIVDGGEKPISALTRKSAVLKVRLRNSDIEKNTFAITHGGDYRSGRHARWRIHVVDANGKLLQCRPRRHGMGGGMYSQRFLEFGDEIEIQLLVSNYVYIQSPGTYKLTVLYHDSECIADFTSEQVSRGLCYQSKPITLEVKKGPFIDIELAPNSDAKTRTLLSEIDDEATIKFALPMYTEQWHSFISPESAHGQLLMMGKQTVPALIEALDKDSIGLSRRSWILALLYSALPEERLNPIGGFLTGRNVLTRHSYKMISGEGTAGGSPSKDAQMKLAREWKQFYADYVRVVRKTK